MSTLPFNSLPELYRSLHLDQINQWIQTNSPVSYNEIKPFITLQNFGLFSLGISIFYCIYNYFFSPLAGYPGPLSAKLGFDFWLLSRAVKKDTIWRLREQHNKHVSILTFRSMFMGDELGWIRDYTLELLVIKFPLRIPKPLMLYLNRELLHSPLSRHTSLK